MGNLPLGASEEELKSKLKAVSENAHDVLLDAKRGQAIINYQKTDYAKTAMDKIKKMNGLSVKFVFEISA